MGLVSSMCKQKQQTHLPTIVQNNSTQTVNHSPSISSEKSQCSAMSREPINNPSFRHQYYFPSEQPRGYPDFPLFSTPFYVPYQDKGSISHRHSNPYIAHAYSHVPMQASPSIHNTDHSRTTLTTSTPTPSRIPTVSDIVQTTGDEYRTLRRVESFVTTDTNQTPPPKKDLDDGARLIKRAAAAPIDMFLIDISNEQVLVGQPVSMNIRHLLLDSLENHQSNASTPVRIEPTNITTYAHENLLAYIPYVCDRYPNVTVESDQPTRNTLHVRVPSQFSRSLSNLSSV